jgi:hypothetical protein
MSRETLRVGKEIDTKKCLGPKEVGIKGAAECLLHEFCLIKDQSTSFYYCQDYVTGKYCGDIDNKCVD